MFRTGRVARQGNWQQVGAAAATATTRKQAPQTEAQWLRADAESSLPRKLSAPHSGSIISTACHFQNKKEHRGYHLATRRRRGYANGFYSFTRKSVVECVRAQGLYH